MIDFRIYRVGFVPALFAIIVLLFALQGAPPPLAPVVAPVAFDQESAARTARQIVEKAPVRTPGSPGDAAIAKLVERQFRGARDAQVAEQLFTGSFDGRDVALRNLILTLPGTSARSIVVLASRDTASGPGAASSAAATASLLELAKELENSRHAKTLIFVSTDGASDGALGAQEFAQHYPRRALIDGAIVLWQPGSASRRQPYLLDTSDGPRSASAGLVRTAQRALADQLGAKPDERGTLGQLAGLAFPSGLGDQAPLIERGINAVGLSSAGERPLPASADQLQNLSASTLGDLGRTALLLAVTLDHASAAPEHGPDSYVTLAGNLVPGWTLALFTLTLLLPAGFASLDGLRRALRGGQRIGWALWWAASRAAPLVASLLLLYLLAVVGLVASPRFPFDPDRFGIGAGQVIVMVMLGVVIVTGCYAARAWRVPAGLGGDAAAAALGLISVGAVLVAWLANPFLALLLVPVAHVWLLDATRRESLSWPVVLAGAALSLVPVAAALADLTSRLELGSTAPWQLLLMVTDGQLGFGAMLVLCLLAGCLIGVVAVAGRTRSSQPPADLARRVPARSIGARRATVGDLDASPIARGTAPDDLGKGR